VHTVQIFPELVMSDEKLKLYQNDEVLKLVTK